MPEPSVEPRPPLAAELRLTVPLDAQDASYFAASERIANRSFSDLFIIMFTICSFLRRQAVDRDHALRSDALVGWKWQNIEFPGEAGRISVIMT